jgi:hypothetical protein
MKTTTSHRAFAVLCTANLPFGVGPIKPHLRNELVAPVNNVELSDSRNLAMSGGGSKPGERRGGRQKGTPNKLSIGRMKARSA